MKRRTFLHKAIAAGSVAGISSTLFNACVTKDKEMTTSSSSNKIKIGFIPLTDCASVVMAHELGLFDTPHCSSKGILSSHGRSRPSLKAVPRPCV